MRVGCWPPPSTAPSAASGWRRSRERRPRSTRRRRAVRSRPAAVSRKPAAPRNCRPTSKWGRSGSHDAFWRNAVRPSPQNNSALRICSASDARRQTRSGPQNVADWSRHAGRIWIGSLERGAEKCRAQAGGLMQISNEGILVILFVGLVAGWLAGKIVRGTGFGIIGDILVGVAGALVASFLFPKLGIALGTGIVREIIYSAIGAVVLLLIVRLVRTGGRF